MANKSGLGSKKDWTHVIDDVQKEFAGYAAAHNHYVQAVSAAGNASFGGGHTQGSSHAHSVIKEGWQPVYKQEFPPGYYNGVALGTVEPVDFEEAKPFIRLVIERMLALMATEANWVKGTSTQWNDDADVEQFCLIGAQARALAELGLNATGNTELDTARKRVLAAIDRFLVEAVKESTGFESMPSFNDRPSTTFEDVRLWLKSLFDK